MENRDKLMSHFGKDMATLSQNTLQAYFKKRDEPLPVYTITKIGGDDFSPVWQGSVEMHGYPTIFGNPATSKRVAKMNVAAYALETLRKATDYEI